MINTRIQAGGSIYLIETFIQTVIFHVKTGSKNWVSVSGEREICIFKTTSIVINQSLIMPTY